MMNKIVTTLAVLTSLFGYLQTTEECADNPNPVVIDATPTLEANHGWVYNHGTNSLEGRLKKTGEANYEEGQPTPSTTGNTSKTVLKIVRGGNGRASSGFHIFTRDFDSTKGVLKFRVFPECNLNAVSNVKVRVRKDEDKSTQISYKTIKLKENQWNEVTINLSSGKTKNTKPNSLFNQILFMFNHPDRGEGSSGAVFYIDAVQVPESSLKPTTGNAPDTTTDAPATTEATTEAQTK